MVRVRDLAIIRDDFEEERLLTRINGKTMISFELLKSENADLIETVDTVKTLVEKEKTLLPPDSTIDFSYTMDRSRYVRSKFQIVRSNLLIGLVLVLIVLASIPFWRMPSSLDRPRAVTETDLSPTALQELFRRRGPSLHLSGTEFEDVKACIDLSRLTRHTRDGISVFTEVSTRHALQARQATSTHPFYAEFLLAKWYESHDDPNQAAQWMARALA